MGMEGYAVTYKTPSFVSAPYVVFVELTAPALRH
jgi:hypothetical protein